MCRFLLLVESGNILYIYIWYILENKYVTFFYLLGCIVGFLLLVKVTAVTFCVTLSASLAARQGSTTMAAFQICLQIWMATSLLADGLAVAGQVRN
jgi:Na+-driven multidrug efflux pump